MKKIFKTIVIFIITINCTAQSPIINIEDISVNHTQGTYFRDTNNLLNPFEGTYLYTDGTTSLEIVLQKKVMNYDGWYYEDLLIGEYRFIENGVIKMNTLDNLNFNYPNKKHHSIDGYSILQVGDYACFDCVGNEKLLRVGLIEKYSNSLATVYLKRIEHNGHPAMRMELSWHYAVHKEGTPKPLQPSFRGGEYILIKQ